jgi:alpha-galactosidase
MGLAVLDSEKTDYKMVANTRSFYDKTKTTATIIKNLYKAIQKGVGDKDVIGCNTVGHLTAGIHSVYRIGHDTSGRSFEWTRRDGINSVMRLPLNNAFYNADPDCAAFTERVPIDINLDFLEACANTGVVTLASVKPGIVKGKDLARIRKIYKTASEGGIGAVPDKWVGNNAPSKFTAPNGEKFDYDWYKVYDGIRTFYTWKN